jgi:hypothetical protein
MDHIDDHSSSDSPPRAAGRARVAGIAAAAVAGLGLGALWLGPSMAGAQEGTDDSTTTQPESSDDEGTTEDEDSTERDANCDHGEQSPEAEGSSDTSA